MSDAGLDIMVVCGSKRTRAQIGLESAKHAVFRTGFDADEIEDVDDDEEDAKDTANHDQSPGHLMRALIFFAHGADLAMRENPKRYEGEGEAEANNPVEHCRSASVLRG